MMNGTEAGIARCRPWMSNCWRWLHRFLIVAFGLAVIGLGSGPSSHPRLIVADSVASDLQMLAQQTWGRFLAAFAGRTACFGDVTLQASPDLASRASYDPHTATVTVRVPGSAAMLQSALIHEWAHHLEFQCPQQAAMRPAFLAAQGWPADTPWRPAHLAPHLSTGTWADIPSEQFAEATIEYVLGARPIPTAARVRAEAVTVIAAWAAGR